MNRCIKGQAASSSHGNAPSTCAVCSVRRKNAATAKKPAHTMPLLLRQKPVDQCSVTMRLQTSCRVDLLLQRTPSRASGHTQIPKGCEESLWWEAPPLVRLTLRD